MLGWAAPAAYVLVSKEERATEQEPLHDHPGAEANGAGQTDEEEVPDGLAEIPPLDAGDDADDQGHGRALETGENGGGEAGREDHHVLCAMVADEPEESDERQGQREEHARFAHPVSGVVDHHWVEGERSTNREGEPAADAEHPAEMAEERDRPRYADGARYGAGHLRHPERLEQRNQRALDQLGERRPIEADGRQVRIAPDRHVDRVS